MSPLSKIPTFAEQLDALEAKLRAEMEETARMKADLKWLDEQVKEWERKGSPLS